MKIGIAGNGKIVHEMIGATKNIQDLEMHCRDHGSGIIRL